LKPFIFMNAAGLHRDLDTMVHEAGHAFHSILCHGEPLRSYRHSPIEFAEVASMSMELFAFPYLGEFYDDADAARARRKRLESPRCQGPMKIVSFINPGQRDVIDRILTHRGL
ncbi:MAG: M3 family metallopeptidase, partial [Planctomycetota bacterium]